MTKYYIPALKGNRTPNQPTIRPTKSVTPNPRNQRRHSSMDGVASETGRWGSWPKNAPSHGHAERKRVPRLKRHGRSKHTDQPASSESRMLGMLVPLPAHPCAGRGHCHPASGLVLLDRPGPIAIQHQGWYSCDCQNQVVLTPNVLFLRASTVTHGSSATAAVLTWGQHVSTGYRFYQHAATASPNATITRRHMDGCTRRASEAGQNPPPK